MRHDLEFLSIPNVVRRAAASWPHSEAIVDGEIRWTFAELEVKLLESVKAAMAMGVQPGDRVALWAPNMANWIVAAVGIQGAGGILVPLNTRFKAQEVDYILTKSGAKALICIEDFLGADYIQMLKTGAPETFKKLTVVSVGETKHDDVSSWSDYLSAGAHIDDQTAHASIDAVGPDDLSDIMFTSGTTGKPKGVQLTHGQSLRVFGWVAETFTFTPGDRYLVIPPFFHTFGYKCGWMADLITGVTTLPQATFDTDEILKKIVDEKVTILLGPPTLFTDIMNHPDFGTFDLSSLRVTVPSSTMVPVELVHQLKDVMKFDVVITAYGLTEATSFLTTSHPGDDPEDVASSVGQVMDDIELIVVDEFGNPLPAGQQGEVLARGFNVMRGYWEDPVATAEVIDDQGWLHTGDIGEFNERGFLKITDRLKDVVIVGGFNVYPAEVERILLQHDRIQHASVIGVPDARQGEVTAAFVVPTPGSDLTADDVTTFSREHMANFKAPRYVWVVSELPRNASQKVLKHELRQKALSLINGPATVGS